jgi:hypothetical protein
MTYQGVYKNEKTKALLFNPFHLYFYLSIIIHIR